MSENSLVEVVTGVDLLMEVIEEAIQSCYNSLGEELKTHNINSSQAIHNKKDAFARVEKICEFRDKVASLRPELNELMDKARRRHGRGRGTSKRRNYGKIPRGTRTSEEEFFRPILESLNEMGGAGSMTDVLDCVFKKMDSSLKDVDRKMLESNSKMPRWRNTAQFARNQMTKQGLLRGGSQRGIWEITDAGRQELVKMQERDVCAV